MLLPIKKRKEAKEDIRAETATQEQIALVVVSHNKTLRSLVPYEANAQASLFM